MKKIATKTVLIAIITLSLLQGANAYADLTGYSPAPYPGSWAVSDWGTWKSSSLDYGEMRYWKHVSIENVGAFPLTEAKARIFISKIWYWDGTAWVPTTDPAIIDEKIEVLNAEKVGEKIYLVDLGTIPVGHEKKMLLNVWTSEPIGFQFALSVWYLP